LVSEKTAGKVRNFKIDKLCALFASTLLKNGTLWLVNGGSVEILMSAALEWNDLIFCYLEDLNYA
jgi:hypothetical protein